MTFDLVGQLADGLTAGRWRDTDLWIAGVALGANLDLGDVAHIVAGVRAPTRNEYQVLAAALNDHLEDLGLDNPILYWNDVPPEADTPRARM